MKNGKIHNIPSKATLFLSFSLFLSSGAWAAEMVIIDQQGTSYEIGQVIDDTKPFLLAVDKRVTLLSHSGELIKLVGPYSDKPTLVETKNNARSDMLSAIGQIIGRQKESTSNFGFELSP